MKGATPKGADGKPVHPISAEALTPVVAKHKAAGKPFKMGMVFPVSTHNYELRYWLAAGGIKRSAPRLARTLVHGCAAVNGEARAVAEPAAPGL